MKLETTMFGNKKVLNFDSLVYVHFTPSLESRYVQNKEIVKQVKISDGPLKVSEFFRDVALLMRSWNVRKSLNEENEHYQFGVIDDENEIVPLKWFSLVSESGDVISHDIAFDVTYIKKNGMKQPLGSAAFISQYDNKVFPRYREFNMKNRAYKYVANQVKMWK